MQTFINEDYCVCRDICKHHHQLKNKDYPKYSTKHSEQPIISLFINKPIEYVMKPIPISGVSKYALYYRYYLHNLFCESISSQKLSKEICLLICEYIMEIIIAENKAESLRYFNTHCVIYNCLWGGLFETTKILWINKQSFLDILIMWPLLNPLLLSEIATHQALPEDLGIQRRKTKSYKQRNKNLNAWINLQWSKILDYVEADENFSVVEIYDFKIKINSKTFYGIPFVTECVNAIKCIDEEHINLLRSIE